MLTDRRINRLADGDTKVVSHTVTRTVFTVLLAPLVVIGCGVTFFGTLAAPSGLAATPGRTDLIELTWNEVTGADVYYVYRSLSADGPFRAEGPSVSIPYRTVTQPALLDVDTDPTSYFYTVSAGRLSTGEESAMSEVVRGTRVAEEIGWRDQAMVFGAPGTIRLAVDRTTPTIQAYVLTVGNGIGANASVRRIEADGTLTNLGGPPEPTDGTDTRVADLAAAGAVYVAVVAEDPPIAADRDKVFLYRYDTELEQWLLIEGPLFALAHPSAPFVTMVAIGTGDLLISYRDDGGVMALYRFNGTLSPRMLPPPADTDDTPENAWDSIGQIDGAAVPGTAVLLYELEDDDLATLRNTTSLQVSVWNGSSWPAGTTVYNGATGNIETGAAAVAIDPTVTPSANGVALAYLDESDIHLVDHVGAVVPGSTTGFSGLVDVLGTWVGLAAQSGVISLFYLDLAQEAGAVAQFDAGTASWAQFSPPDFTQSSSPTGFSLAGGGGKWFTAFDDDGITRVRTYQ